jgi:hypothetical protein
MLLRNVTNPIFSKIDAVGNFVIVNIINFSYFEFFVMQYNLSHYNSFSGFDVLFNLFSGNNYFVFIDKHSYYNDLLDLFSNSDSNYEVLAVCWDNYFINYNNPFFNISNNFFFVLFFSIICICIFVNLFFSKLMTIYVKINLFESKNRC